MTTPTAEARAAQLDALAEAGTAEVVLAVWAARVADINGDTAEVERWTTAAATANGTLF